MSTSVGSTPATVRPGETAQATIQLHGGPVIAKAFVIHFARDSAFIEPPMRPVLRQVAEYAAAHPKEKLLIVGHTDLTGSAEYNQSLSERRARSAYAFLTYGSDGETALAEWNNLRLKRPKGQLPSIHDTWGVREYQHILQDLGYYMGNINGIHDSLTNKGMAIFQKDHQLGPCGGIVTDKTWDEWLKAYLSKDRLIVSSEAFFSKEGESLKWLGCGELDPVDNRQDGWRPNRRTELLFIEVAEFSFEIKQPDTFELPEKGIVGTSWKFGTSATINRCQFAVRDGFEAGRWLIRPIEPGTLDIHGSIRFTNGQPLANAKFELIAPDGTCMNGEHPTSCQPIPGRTDDEGGFSFLNIISGYGVYNLIIQGSYVVLVSGDDGQSEMVAKGNAAWNMYDISSKDTKTNNVPKLATLDHAIGSSAHGKRDIDAKQASSITKKTLHACVVGPSEIILSFETYECKAASEYVQIEGLLNDRLGSKRCICDDLMDDQQRSLFYVTAYVPEQWPIDTVEIHLSSFSRDGQMVSMVKNLILCRGADGKFRSCALLAVPQSLIDDIPENGKTGEYAVVGSLAGGFLYIVPSFITTTATHPLTQQYAARVGVRGRVIYVYVQVITRCYPSLLKPSKSGQEGFIITMIKKHVKLASRIWAQVGIEVKERIIAGLNRNEIMDLSSIKLKTDSTPIECTSVNIDVFEAEILDLPSWLLYTDQARRICGLYEACLDRTSPECPPTSSVSTDIDVFYVDDIVDDNILGYTIRSKRHFVRPTMIMELPNYEYTLAHELGHFLLMDAWQETDWKKMNMKSPKSEHHSPLGANTPWPKSNVMSTWFSDQTGGDVDKAQRLVILRNAKYADKAKHSESSKQLKVGLNYCVVFEPQ